jgi:hypothetical protein
MLLVGLGWVGWEVAPILLVAPGLKEMLVGLLLEGVLLLVKPNLEPEEQEHWMQLMISWPSSSCLGDAANCKTLCHIFRVT